MNYAEVFSLLGGVGLFLFGMSIMSTGLKNSCGDNLQNILAQATRNKYISVFVGFALTLLVQSSSATDVMVIGFVNSSLMTLSQAIGVIMGANIGTTVTAQITAFNISTFTPLMLFAGAAMYLFCKKELIKHIGSVIMGFGMLFQGITIMKAAIAPLAQSEGFVTFMSTLSNPAVAVLFGLAFTALLQSSSSSTVLFQAFAVQGLITYNIAVYLVIGAAIGSVTPNILASFAANRNGKRTAILNLLFNLIRATIVLLLITIFPQVLVFIQSLSAGDVARQIANTHTIFAVLAVLIELPFADKIVKLTYKIFPLDSTEETEDERQEAKLHHMTQIKNLPPAMGIYQAQLETARMGRIAKDNFADAVECLFNFDEDLAAKVRRREKNVDALNFAIEGKMTELSAMDLSSDNLRRISNITIAVTDVERISDHAENVIEYAEQMKEKKITFSEAAVAELRAMADRTIKAIELSIEIFATEKYDTLPEVLRLEDLVDRDEVTLVNNHVKRLMKDNCSPASGVIFADIVTDFERCSDHAVNIAYANKAQGEKERLSME